MSYYLWRKISNNDLARYFLNLANRVIKCKRYKFDYVSVVTVWSTSPAKDRNKNIIFRWHTPTTIQTFCRSVLFFFFVNKIKHISFDSVFSSYQDYIHIVQCAVLWLDSNGLDTTRRDNGFCSRLMCINLKKTICSTLKFRRPRRAAGRMRRWSPYTSHVHNVPKSVWFCRVQSASKDLQRRLWFSLKNKN